MRNDYVLDHDFGYGKGLDDLNKLNLRNIEDLKVYVNDAIVTLFVALVKDNVVEFLTDNTKTKIIIERV